MELLRTDWTLRAELMTAAFIMTTTFKSLDVIHHASNHLVASDLDVSVTYGSRLGTAASRTRLAAVQLEERLC